MSGEPTPDCRGPGQLAPVIDRSRCEAKGDCTRVCPYGVFEVRAVADEDRVALGPLGRLRLWVHRGRQAYVKAPADCHACGLCVQACPERAITLRAR